MDSSESHGGSFSSSPSLGMKSVFNASYSNWAEGAHPGGVYPRVERADGFVHVVAKGVLDVLEKERGVHVVLGGAQLGEAFPKVDEGRKWSSTSVRTTYARAASGPATVHWSSWETCALLFSTKEKTISRDSPCSLTDTLVTLLASTARGPRSIHETLKKVYVLWVY